MGPLPFGPSRVLTGRAARYIAFTLSPAFALRGLCAEYPVGVVTRLTVGSVTTLVLNPRRPPVYNLSYSPGSACGYVGHAIETRARLASSFIQGSSELFDLIRHLF
jgi:hypothetical protein